MGLDQPMTDVTIATSIFYIQFMEGFGFHYFFEKLILIAKCENTVCCDSEWVHIA